MCGPACSQSWLPQCLVSPQAQERAGQGLTERQQLLSLWLSQGSGEDAPEGLGFPSLGQTASAMWERCSPWSGKTRAAEVSGELAGLL